MGDRNYTPMIGDATEQSHNFKDNSIDLVIIDLAHEYEAVKNDIEVWLPKVKTGGYIIGDDYEKYWSHKVKW
jgi:predicted O-methyltransferase YrrM